MGQKFMIRKYFALQKSGEGFNVAVVSCSSLPFYNITIRVLIFPADDAVIEQLYFALNVNSKQVNISLPHHLAI
jgi:hypothetical protein